jgi:serine/threonine protein kinase
MDATDSTCPTPGDLRQFLGGRVAGGSANTVAEHLIGCERCRESAVSMSSQSVVADAIRSWARRIGEGPPEGSAKSSEQTAAVAPVTAAATRVEPSGEKPADDEPLTQYDDYNALDPPLQPDELGRLGPYRIIELLGEGGMGVVYRAEDPQLGRLVALKVMRPSVAASPAARQRFLREARATAALEHDHIVTIFQVGEANGIPYLAMQLLVGQTLDERLKAGSAMPVAEILRIGRQVAEGLSAAHDQGLVHRDIKPANIWIESLKNRIKILDFGLARPVSQATEVTATGVVLGTPAYMAPEQAGGDSIDGRCDLFSLGCVLYRMATGVLPFPGANALAILRALALETPKPVKLLRPDVPAALSDLIDSLLSKDRTRRPPSAAKVVAAIEAIELGLSLSRPASMRSARPGFEPPPTSSAPPPVRSVPGPGVPTAFQQAIGDEIGLAPDASELVPIPKRPAQPGTHPASSASNVGRPAGSTSAQSGVRPGQPPPSASRHGPAPARSGISPGPTLPGTPAAGRSGVRPAGQSGIRPDPTSSERGSGGAQADRSCLRPTPPVSPAGSRPPGASGMRPLAPSSASSVRPTPAEPSPPTESDSDLPPEPPRKPRTRRLASARDQVPDTSFLFEEAPAASNLPLGGFVRPRKRSKPIPWPLVIGSAVLVVMALLVVLLVMKHR